MRLFSESGSVIKKKKKDIKVGRAVFYAFVGENLFSLSRSCETNVSPTTNCFSSRPGMPPPLLPGIPVIPPEIPIEYVCSIS